MPDVWLGYGTGSSNNCAYHHVDDTSSSRLNVITGVHSEVGETAWDINVLLTCVCMYESTHNILVNVHDSSRLSLIWMGLNIHSCLC